MITLATLPQATAQEVFDQVVNHLREQGCKSETRTGGMCAYRVVKEGKLLMCAAGCLISEKEYKQSFEGKTWSALDVPSAHSSLIDQLQYVHDMFYITDWEQRFMQVAKRNDLLYTLQETKV